MTTWLILHFVLYSTATGTWSVSRGSPPEVHKGQQVVSRGSGYLQCTMNSHSNVETCCIVFTFHCTAGLVLT